MLDSESVGIYTAAVRASEFIFFLFLIIINSLYPTVVNTLAVEEIQERDNRILKYSSFVIYTVLFYSLVVYPFLGHIIKFTFREQYYSSTEVLKVHIFSNFFTFIGGMTHQWHIYYGFTKLALYRVLQGAVLNVILNLIFIPIYSTTGAALATFIIYGYVAIFAMYFHQETRNNFYLVIKSFTMPVNLILRK